MEGRRWNNGGRCERESWTGGGGLMRNADGRRRRWKTMRRGVGRCSCRKYRRSGCWWNEEETPSASSVGKNRHTVVHVGVKIQTAQEKRILTIFIQKIKLLIFFFLSTNTMKGSVVVQKLLKTDPSVTTLKLLYMMNIQQSPTLCAVVSLNSYQFQNYTRKEA